MFECEILDFGRNGLAFSVVDGDTVTEERLEIPVIRKDYAGHSKVVELKKQQKQRSSLPIYPQRKSFYCVHSTSSKNRIIKGTLKQT